MDFESHGCIGGPCEASSLASWWAGPSQGAVAEGDSLLLSHFVALFVHSVTPAVVVIVVTVIGVVLVEVVVHVFWSSLVILDHRCLRQRRPGV